MTAESFRPSRGLGNPHAQTILTSLGRAPALQPDRQEIVQVAEGVSLRLDVNDPRRAPRGTLLLVHGLAGSAESAYMRWSAWQALQRDWLVVRMNLRGCGGTAALTNSHHNAYQSGDVGAVLKHLAARDDCPRPLAVLSFSLGGNLALRWSGRERSGAVADALAAVGVPIDLDLCCHAIDAPGNLIYRLYFVTRLFKLMREAPHIVLPGPPPGLRTVRTIRQFDDRYTAPSAGFASALDYYRAASSAQDLSGLRVPTLVLAAKDDPFVPVRMFAPHANDRPGTLFLEHPDRGGHVGFRQRGERRFWAAERALDFFDERVARGGH